MERKEYAVIVLHEIYGINPHIKWVCKQYLESGYDVLCPDFLKGKEFFNYNREGEAYQYFIEHIGFNSMTEEFEKILKKAHSNYKRVYLLGFSVGATAAWLCSGLESTVDGAICYYGSRIRDYEFINPKCPVLLIWAKEEKFFDVLELSNALKTKPFVSTHILDGKHGFSDPFSKNYNEQSQKTAQDLVSRFLSSLKGR
ncbi:DeoR faimly transcriptional regulator [Desulfosporosinus sp. HMP52]|uniref:dienelactone hydrolase family protein n=1 Tax=Desulfosporosinus sp. HMP52 TaxID=1487923 RepID=UPI00051FB025|nr:dienelactone hydrolase family protein [Desulfosporosinus sp. HMP52]KGK88099.1 DeoR faimly transcriptional regulator [Desulfosporosinus sp. HMP52]